MQKINASCVIDGITWKIGSIAIDLDGNITAIRTIDKNSLVPSRYLFTKEDLEKAAVFVEVLNA